MSNKILTIIIPSYNMEKYLDRCLSSLVVDEERMALFEALIINDGSKDRTSEIGHQYESLFPGTFRVIDKKNGHYGSCVNAGLREAQGNYVKVLDADDYFGPGFPGFLSFLQEVNTDLVLSGSISVDENGSELSRTLFPLPQNTPLDKEEIISHGITHLEHFNISYRTEVLRDMGYKQTEGISYTDLEWATLPSCKVKNVAYFPEIIYCYFKGRTGQTVDIGYRKKNMWMENSVVLGIAKRYEELKGQIDPDNLPLFKALVRHLVLQIYFHYLVNYAWYLNRAELVSFDRDLLAISPELYDSVTDAKEKRKFGTFHYISDFRRQNFKHLLFKCILAPGFLFRK